MNLSSIFEELNKTHKPKQKIGSTLSQFHFNENWVLHWHPNAGSTANSQILHDISQCIESINGVRDGRWKVQIRQWWRNSHMISSGYRSPMNHISIYFVVRGQRIIVEARVMLNFEGVQYRFGDFRVRVGKVFPSHSESMRGVVMEVEYLPISSIEQSKQIMKEFLEMVQETLSNKSLPGQFTHTEPNFAEYALSNQYISQHAAIQYSTVMAQLIASSQLAQAGRN
ncbi:Mediator of RNA polymerase II transcription subunit 20a-like protein [Drosera capensis]